MLDDERTARGQPHLAIEALLELLGDLEPLEQREALIGAVVELHAVTEGRRDGRHIVVHVVEELRLVDDDGPVVGVELLADHPHRHVGLAVQQRRTLLLRGQRCDLFPLPQEATHVAFDLLGGHAFGGGAHDHAVLGGLDPVEDLTETLALVVGEPLGDAERSRVGHEHDEPAGQGHLLGEARALVADRVLGDLTHDELPVLEHLLDTRALAAGGLDVVGVEVDVVAVEHRVLGRADVDERRLHTGQHILDAADVDVAVDLADIVGRPGDVMLEQHSSLEDRDVGARILRHVDVHLVAADRLALALTPGPLLEGLGVELDRTVFVDQRRLDRARRLRLRSPAALVLPAPVLSAFGALAAGAALAGAALAGPRRLCAAGVAGSGAPTATATTGPAAAATPATGARSAAALAAGPAGTTISGRPFGARRRPAVADLRLRRARGRDLGHQRRRRVGRTLHGLHVGRSAG